MASIPDRPRRRTGCFQRVFISEDNARFFLLVIILGLYLLLGTFVFYYLEHDEDERKRLYYAELWRNFSRKYDKIIDDSDLQQLFQAGSLSYLPFQQRPAMGLYDSFYLAFTACTTIGFGHLVPATVNGRAVMIVYGLFGCSAVILFYNLFLERIITLLALVLKSFYDIKRRREEKKFPSQRRDSSSSVSSSGGLENWKPSVYWVMVCLFCLITIIASTTSAVFSAMEQWDYFTALYFSFVCFATIGFGDLVSGTRDSYGSADGIYRFFHFVLIVVGTSTLYSLFNVISIIIKHGLNYLIKKIDRELAYRIHNWNKAAQTAVNNRRNAIIPRMARDSNVPSERRFSDEVMDVSEFLQASKVSLAVMQKDLQEMAQKGVTGYHVNHVSRQHPPHFQALMNGRKNGSDFTPSNIGPMAIVEHTLGEDT